MAAYDFMGDAPQGEELTKSASRLYRIRKTTLKMMKKRGYNIDEGMLNQSSNDFALQFGRVPDKKALNISLEKVDDDKDTIFISFTIEENDKPVGVKPVKELTEKMVQHNTARALMIVKHSVTPFAKSAIAICQTQQKINIEVWTESDLLVDITEHELVPTHEVLDEQSKRELLARYRLKPGQLPRIQHKDPVARYYGMEKGQVVRITRDSETAGRYVTYRICV
jgi:DNA-directed RNA polymerase I, II, and III subunit RPABC1